MRRNLLVVHDLLEGASRPGSVHAIYTDFLLHHLDNNRELTAHVTGETLNYVLSQLGSDYAAWFQRLNRALKFPEGYVYPNARSPSEQASSKSFAWKELEAIEVHHANRYGLTILCVNDQTYRQINHPENGSHILTVMELINIETLGAQMHNLVHLTPNPQLAQPSSTPSETPTAAQTNFVAPSTDGLNPERASPDLVSPDLASPDLVNSDPLTAKLAAAEGEEVPLSQSQADSRSASQAAQTSQSKPSIPLPIRTQRLGPMPFSPGSDAWQILFFALSQVLLTYLLRRSWLNGSEEFQPNGQRLEEFSTLLPPVLESAVLAPLPGPVPLIQPLAAQPAGRLEVALATGSQPGLSRGSSPERETFNPVEAVSAEVDRLLEPLNSLFNEAIAALAGATRNKSGADAVASLRADAGAEVNFAPRAGATGVTPTGPILPALLPTVPNQPPAENEPPAPEDNSPDPKPNEPPSAPSLPEVPSDGATGELPDNPATPSEVDEPIDFPDGPADPQSESFDPPEAGPEIGPEIKPEIRPGIEPEIELEAEPPVQPFQPQETPVAKAPLPEEASGGLYPMQWIQLPDGQATIPLMQSPGSSPLQYTIQNFGGVGQGVSPSLETIRAVDTLQFFGAEFTPERMLLQQQGNDLSITFEDSPLKVVLQHFQLENLDNLSTETWASVTIGNILFNGQTTIQDSFDVIDAKLNIAQVLRPNTVTFLNDLDNFTGGYAESNDVIDGLTGNDKLYGLSGNDKLRGSEGNDLLYGDEGDDYLLGGEGDDLLNAGTAEQGDRLNGGAGSDLFVLRTDSKAVVEDFELGRDKLRLGESGLSKAELDQLTLQVVGNDTLLFYDQRQFATLENVKLTSLDLGAVVG